MAKKPASAKTVATLQHEEAKRKNIPTAEYQSVLQKEQENPVRVAYERRNRDLDPQLVWRGKDQQDWSDLVVHAHRVLLLFPQDGLEFRRGDVLALRLLVLEGGDSFGRGGFLGHG